MTCGISLSRAGHVCRHLSSTYNAWSSLPALKNNTITNLHLFPLQYFLPLHFCGNHGNMYKNDKINIIWLRIIIQNEREPALSLRRLNHHTVNLSVIVSVHQDCYLRLRPGYSRREAYKSSWGPEEGVRVWRCWRTPGSLAWRQWNCGVSTLAACTHDAYLFPHRNFQIIQPSEGKIQVWEKCIESPRESLWESSSFD